VSTWLLVVNDILSTHSRDIIHQTTVLASPTETISHVLMTAKVARVRSIRIMISARRVRVPIQAVAAVVVEVAVEAAVQVMPAMCQAMQPIPHILEAELESESEDLGVRRRTQRFY
jgi:hypothetical protein